MYSDARWWAKWANQPRRTGAAGALRQKRKTPGGSWKRRATRSRASGPTSRSAATGWAGGPAGVLIVLPGGLWMVATRRRGAGRQAERAGAAPYGRASRFARPTSQKAEDPSSIERTMTAALSSQLARPPRLRSL
ncbi:unnamed protein product [Amoebophrya sp. A120]|nr:unnamed protein product [Amoebophrya sp. A120]|eukprot:GSA120T00020661001.1